MSNAWYAEAHFIKLTIQLTQCTEESIRQTRGDGHFTSLNKSTTYDHRRQQARPSLGHPHLLLAKQIHRYRTRSFQQRICRASERSCSQRCHHDGATYFFDSAERHSCRWLPKLCGPIFRKTSSSYASHCYLYDSCNTWPTTYLHAWSRAVSHAG